MGTPGTATDRRALATAALAACPDHLLLVTRDGQILDGQRSLDGPDLPGLRAGLSGDSLQSAFDRADAALLVELVAQALDSDDIVEGEIGGDSSPLHAVDVRIAAAGTDRALVLLRDISRLRIAERALRDERSASHHAGLALAVEQSPVGVMITDAEGRIEHVNPRFSETTGFAAHEVIGHTPRVISSGTHPPEFYRGIWTTLQSGGTWRGEICNRRKNGTLFWAAMSASPVLDGTGQLRHFVAVIEDITDRRLARQQHAMILRAALDGFWILDGATHIVEANDAYGRLSLYSPDELPGRCAEELVAAEDIERLRAGLARAAADGADRFEVRHRRRDGTLFDAEMGVQYTDMHGGRYACFVADVTERNRVSHLLETANMELEARVDERTRALVQANAQLRLSEFSLEHAPVGAVWADRDGRLLRANAVAARILERDAGALNDCRVADLDVSPAARDRWIAHRTAGRSGQARTFEANWQRRDGDTVPVEIAARWMEFDGQDYWIAFIQDLTERRLAQRQQLRAQRLESIGTLAGGVAHDLNNMIAPIVMGIETLGDNPAVDRETLETMATSARHAQDVLRQLLTFARGRDGERMPVSLTGLIDELEAMVRHTFPKRIAFTRSGSATRDFVMGNATQLHQVLLNLCVNARDAMKKGGSLTLAVDDVAPEALAGDVAGALAQTYLAIRVEDTGDGIPPEVLDRIFDPFFTTKGPDLGTGLGLSTALGIVRSHGGALRVSSTPGTGTAFTVYLPAVDPSSVS